MEATAQAICDLSLRFGEEGSKGEKMSRPFGVALLLGGVDGGTPALYHCDPSGTFIPSDAKAIGSGAEGAQANLEEHYHQVCMRLSAALILSSSPSPDPHDVRLLHDVLLTLHLSSPPSR